MSTSLDQTNLALAVAGITFVVLACALITSVSEQKRAEAALRQARADLAHVNRVSALGELTASLAHEVNQPIAAVVFSAGACSKWLAAETPNLDEARAAAKNVDKTECVPRKLSVGSDSSQKKKALSKGSWLM